MIAMLKKFDSSIIHHLKTAWALEDYVIAEQVLTTDDLDTLSPGDVVIVSMDDKIGEAVRRKFYGFGRTEVRIFDLGHYRSDEAKPLIDLCRYVWSHRAYVLLLSSQPDDVFFHYLHDTVEDIRHTACIARSTGDTYRLYDRHSFVTIGYQAHRGRPEHLYKSQNMDRLRLGELRSYFAEAEPLIRDAQLCYFNLDAVHYNAAPAQSSPSTSGLTSEEACHLSQYAGQAESNQMFWICNLIADYDIRQLTADLVAQMMWYYCQGCIMRKDPYPLDLERLSSYIIEFDNLDVPLAFYKSPYSDRWWVRNTFHSDSKPIPCSIRDYELSKQGELSDRLLRLLAVYSR